VTWGRARDSKVTPSLPRRVRRRQDQDEAEKLPFYEYCFHDSNQSLGLRVVLVFDIGVNKNFLTLQTTTKNLKLMEIIVFSSGNIILRHAVGNSIERLRQR
jgi:hypothetical protein